MQALFCTPDCGEETLLSFLGEFPFYPHPPSNYALQYLESVEKITFSMCIPAVFRMVIVTVNNRKLFIKN